MRNEIPPVYHRHLSRRHRVALEGAGLSLASLTAGLALVLAVSVGAPYSIWIAGSSELTWSYFPIGVGAPFVLLVLGNALCRRLWGIGLQAAELVTAVIMGLAASGMPVFVVGYILSIISKPYYGASPQNRWAEYVQPHLPTWAVPAPDGDAMRFFYEGLPDKSLPIPWGTWIGPLLWWLALVLALYFACFCIVVVLRRQWMERERLAFPLTEVPLMLTRPDPGHVLPAALRSKVFWIGVAVPLSVILFNMIGYFSPGLTPIPFFGNNPWRLLAQGPTLNMLVYFPVIGFMYLVPTAVSFSMWFFCLLHIVQSGLLSQMGSPALRADPFVISWSALSWQSWGAFVAMVLWSLWMARHHLASVGRLACGRGRDTDGDDNAEVIPYWLAVWGGLAALLFLLGWLWMSGLALGWAILYLGGALLIFLGITRLVVQSGMHYLTTPMTAQGMVLALSGSGIGAPGMVALALSYGWCGDVQSTFMPTAANALKLHDYYTQRRNLGLVLALGLAVSVSFLVTSAFIVWICYDYGAGNLRSWFFNTGGGAGGQAFDSVVRQLRDPFGVEWDKLRFFGAGAGLYSVLALLHLRFSWWPLHPVGLAVASTWMLRRIAFSVFLAWACKRLVLRYGGVKVYQELKPFFVGLVVGFFIGVALGFGVDVMFFKGKGHPILHG